MPSEIGIKTSIEAIERSGKSITELLDDNLAYVCTACKNVVYKPGHPVCPYCDTP